jgi:hypothetical protein
MSTTAAERFRWAPDARLAAYGNTIAQLDLILRPSQQGGRVDPIAMLGRRVGKKANNEKWRRHRKICPRANIQR